MIEFMLRTRTGPREILHDLVSTAVNNLYSFQAYREDLLNSAITRTDFYINIDNPAKLVAMFRVASSPKPDHRNWGGTHI